MSCKKPIFLAIDGVYRELIETAKCGIYVEQENIDAIVQGAKDLAGKSVAEIQQMGTDGYTCAKEHFDRNKSAIKYINKIQ